MMTKHQILETYGKSIYQIRLDVAMRHYGGEADAKRALSIADRFIRELLNEDIDDLKNYGQERL